jgi:hypothetical protein
MPDKTWDRRGFIANAFGAALLALPVVTETHAVQSPEVSPNAWVDRHLRPARRVLSP